MSKSDTPNITYAKKKAAPRRGGAARSLGQKVGDLTKRAFGRRGFSSGELVAEWARVVGDNLASLSSPERITYPRNKRSGGTLHLRVASGSIAVELQHLEPVLLERINGYFGYKAVERVQLSQAPLPDSTKSAKKEKRPLDPEKLAEITQSLTDVDDDELRKSLEGLAHAILRRDSKAD
jgi:hypothetical protein